MALLGQSFNVNDLPEGNSYELVPEGWYDAVITKADLVPTKDKTGERLNIRYDITGPTHQGRVVFSGINIKNKSPEAEDIGRQQLGSIMRSIGLPQLEDTDQLIGGNLKIKVKIREPQNGYEASNDVSGFKASGNASALPQVAKVASAASAPAAASSDRPLPPWAKK